MFVEHRSILFYVWVAVLFYVWIVLRVSSCRLIARCSMTHHLIVEWERVAAHVQRQDNCCKVAVSRWFFKATKNTDIEKPHLRKNKETGCVQQCSADEKRCRSEDASSLGVVKHCWGFDVCQKSKFFCLHLFQLVIYVSQLIVLVN